jgi:energy-coupling factor transporter ATP-binding protein EcfA2
VPNRSHPSPRPLRRRAPSSVDLYATDPVMLNEEIEPLDTSHVEKALLLEVASWKREARSEDNDRYFWHVNEVGQIAKGDKYFVIGRKGSGKTALCEYFNRIEDSETFAVRLSFKSFPFNDLYNRPNSQFTVPNQFITIWKYVIYSSICRLMIKNQAVEPHIRESLEKVYGGTASLSRLVGEWVSSEFTVAFLGVSLKNSKNKGTDSTNWIERVSILEDFLLERAEEAKYYVLFDELDEDYRNIVKTSESPLYIDLITSLFKAVQDVRATFARKQGSRILPVIFLRDDIYDLVQDSDKNKWRDFRVDLSWDHHKIRQVIAFRISRAIDPGCSHILPFKEAWEKLFGRERVRMGQNKRLIHSFDFIARSTLLRPRDFVSYLQNCAEHALGQDSEISPATIKFVDKAFSNYLREEFQDELFAIVPEISSTLDVISQLRKWNFTIPEFESAYAEQVEAGFIKEKSTKYVLQVLFLFDVIGNTPSLGRYVFRYQNKEARLNFNERVVVHRGLFKALQIL